VRVALIAVIVVVAIMSARSPAARSAQALTEMYRGHAKGGEIERDGPRHWLVDADDCVSGEEVFMGARRRALWVRHNGSVDAYATWNGAGRWKIKPAVRVQRAVDPHDVPQ
jgi:hypothetical protein